MEYVTTVENHGSDHEQSTQGFKVGDLLQWAGVSLGDPNPNTGRGIIEDFRYRATGVKLKPLYVLT